MKRRFQSRNNLLHPRNFEFQRWKREQRGGGAVLDKYLFQIIRTVPHAQFHFVPTFVGREKNRKRVIFLGGRRAIKIRLEIKLTVTEWLPFRDASFVIAPLIEIGNSFNPSPARDSVEIEHSND